MRAVKEVQEKMGAGVTGGAPEEPGPRRILGWPARMRQFVHDVRLEMRNVTWPSWPDVQATTIVVLVATFFFGFYLGLALDVPLGRLMDWFLRIGKEWVR
jgi:preprotein translocase subunit SecE